MNNNGSGKDGKENTDLAFYNMYEVESLIGWQGRYVPPLYLAEHKYLHNHWIILARRIQ
jgi:hypothetical protein